MTMYSEGKYDFRSLGQAIKEAREKKNITREQLAHEIDRAPRYIMYIENNGQHPSLDVFYKLVSLLDISVDQYFFPEKEVKRSSRRKLLDSAIDGLDETDYLVLQATINGIIEAKKERTK